MSLPNGHNRRSSSLDRRDPYSSPSVYYDEDAVRRQLLGARNRAVSSVRALSVFLLEKLLTTSSTSNLLASPSPVTKAIILPVEPVMVRFTFRGSVKDFN